MSQNSTLFLCIAFVLLVACSWIEPQVITAEIAITHSCDLLLQRGLETKKSLADTWESSNFAFVQFPNGDSGAVVALGFGGPAQGYRFFYRIRHNQLELIQLIETPGGVEWGLKSLQNSVRATAQVNIEFLHLLRNQSKQIIKMTGATHHGTGLWDDGYFEILVVDDDGLTVIFSGTEYSTNEWSEDHRAEYQFVDLDGDGNTEIIEYREDCKYETNFTTGAIKDLDCTRSQHVYKFDGTMYVE